MSKIIKMYEQSVLVRYDKDPAIPYYKCEDFDGLNCESHDLDGLKYFYYYYDGYKEGEIILFLPGIGPGHTAYLREIETIAKKGYKVLTLDYSGCGESSGEKMISMNSPTIDVVKLLNKADIPEEIMVVGHSLGGYTAINTLNLFDKIKVGVVISGFLSIYLEVKNMVKLPFLAKKIAKYEAKFFPEYDFGSNLGLLSQSEDKILFIQSTDDPIVKYGDATKNVMGMHNPNFSFVIENNKKHNPHYSMDATKYMSDVIGHYSKGIKNKTLDTIEKRKDYFKDVSLERLTNQDEEVWAKIFAHLVNKGE